MQNYKYPPPIDFPPSAAFDLDVRSLVAGPGDVGPKSGWSETMGCTCYGDCGSGTSNYSCYTCHHRPGSICVI